MHNPLTDWCDQIRAAAEQGRVLSVQGQGSKAFHGESPRGEPLSTVGWEGVLSYEPSELVVTVRSGTALSDLEALLAEQGQCLPFEPPRFAGATATVGGMVASGLAGPARASVGGVRDYVLGAELINGRGEAVLVADDEPLVRTLAQHVHGLLLEVDVGEPQVDGLLRAQAQIDHRGDRKAAFGRETHRKLLVVCLVVDSTPRPLIASGTRLHPFSGAAAPHARTRYFLTRPVKYTGKSRAFVG